MGLWCWERMGRECEDAIWDDVIVCGLGVGVRVQEGDKNWFEA